MISTGMQTQELADQAGSSSHDRGACDTDQTNNVSAPTESLEVAHDSKMAFTTPVAQRTVTHPDHAHPTSSAGSSTATETPASLLSSVGRSAPSSPLTDLSIEEFMDLSETTSDAAKLADSSSHDGTINSKDLPDQPTDADAIASNGGSSTKDLPALPCSQVVTEYDWQRKSDRKRKAPERFGHSPQGNPIIMEELAEYEKTQSRVKRIRNSIAGLKAKADASGTVPLVREQSHKLRLTIGSASRQKKNKTKSPTPIQEPTQETTGSPMVESSVTPASKDVTRKGKRNNTKESTNNKPRKTSSAKAQKVEKAPIPRKSNRQVKQVKRLLEDVTLNGKPAKTFPTTIDGPHVINDTIEVRPAPMSDTESASTLPMSTEDPKGTVDVEEEAVPCPPSISDSEYCTLLHASNQIMKKIPMSEKPLPRGRPDIWAETRQALCETVLYYQAWQGACYINKGVLYSFMFDSNGHARDLIDHDVVVARAGGCMTRDKVTGEMYQTKDQKDNAQSAAVRAAIAMQNPIAIFCGSENTDAPSRMPARYCSLGWFKATHVWAERTGSKRGEVLVNIKYRFEKLNPIEVGWWAPAGHDTEQSPSVGSFSQPTLFECPLCYHTSPQIYLEGWMCLTTECSKFWTFPSGLAPRDDDLHYDPRFLKQKTPWANGADTMSLRPALPDPSNHVGDDVSYAMTRGMCCPRCGKCTSRYRWSGWICSNDGCDFEHKPPHPLISASMVRDPWHTISKQLSSCHDWSDPAFVQTQVSFSHNYRLIRFEIPGIDGSVYHLIANQTVVEEAMGPNEMFEALQDTDCGLERRRFVTGKEEFMTAFSNNRGMPYKFAASGDSMSFDGSPWPLTETRSRLNWAARLVLGDGFAKESEFNELLTIGYFDGQNIKYHDDGESGLGPTVATLSLGFPADMLFRIKAKHWTGVSKSGVFNDSRPVPGTLKYEARLAAYNQLIDEYSAYTKSSKRRKDSVFDVSSPHATQQGRVIDSTNALQDGDGCYDGKASASERQLADAVLQHLSLLNSSVCFQNGRSGAWDIFSSHKLTASIEGDSPKHADPGSSNSLPGDGATSVNLTNDTPVGRHDQDTPAKQDRPRILHESLSIDAQLGRIAQKAPSANSDRSDEKRSSDEEDDQPVTSSAKKRKRTNPDQTGRAAHLRKIAKDLGLQDIVKDRKPWMRLRLSHGDIVVMHGRQIQEYLEHQVDPLGRLRFALTCRTILPEHLRPDEMPAYEVKPDDGHYDGSGIRDLKTD